MSPDKKKQLQDLLKKLDSLQKREILPSADLDQTTDALIEQEIANISARLKDNPTIKTLQKFSSELVKFRKDFDLTPVLKSIKDLQTQISESEQEVLTQFEARINAIPKQDLTEITKLKEQVDAIPVDDDSALEAELENLKVQLQTYIENDQTEDELEQKDLQKKLDDLRVELMTRINNRGGGNMNRAIYFGGSDKLRTYTDINFKAGSNVTITTANNNTTKFLDVTISSSGGGGGGTVRSIQSISANQTLDSASGTDYVYLCSGTITVTMPDATAGNTNLYTVKNVGAGTVTINTTSSQTIDGNLTILMPVQYTSVDLISDTANWELT